jgi:hypothetical protein
VVKTANISAIKWSKQTIFMPQGGHDSQYFFSLNCQNRQYFCLKVAVTANISCKKWSRLPIVLLLSRQNLQKQC